MRLLLVIAIALGSWFARFIPLLVLVTNPHVRYVFFSTDKICDEYFCVGPVMVVIHVVNG